MIVNRAVPFTGNTPGQLFLKGASPLILQGTHLFYTPCKNHSKTIFHVYKSNMQLVIINRNPETPLIIGNMKLTQVCLFWLSSFLTMQNIAVFDYAQLNNSTLVTFLAHATMWPFDQVSPPSSNTSIWPYNKVGMRRSGMQQGDVLYPSSRRRMLLHLFPIEQSQS